jgi:hypothetical protein
VFINVYAQEFFDFTDCPWWNVNAVASEEKTKCVVSGSICDVGSSDVVGMCIFLHMIPSVCLK